MGVWAASLPWLCHVILTVTAAPIMLEPLAGKTGPFKLMLYVPGGGVPPEDYLPMVKATQAKSTLTLAVGIPRCHINLCDAIFEVPGLLKDIVASVNTSRKGALPRSDVFITGHSLGGVGARHFYDLWPGSAGLALYGTQYNGDHEDYLGVLGYPLDLKAFPGPLLALTGELDMLPFTHTAELVRQWGSMGHENSFSYEKLPLIIAGMDHSQFCPAFHVKGDILPEISDESATDIISDIVAAWLDAVVSKGADAKDLALLQHYAEKTAPIASPFIQASAMDKTWCESMQLSLADSPKQLRATATHTFDSSSLEHCHPSTSESGGVLTASVCDYRFYENTNSTLPAYAPTYQGAQDIACKMISEDKIAKELGLPAVDMGSKNITNKCRTLNQLAYEAARQLVQKEWPQSLERYSKQGKAVIFQEDSQASIGPQWLLLGLSWSETDAQVEITSKALISTLTSHIYPGNHYCKLLAPSKAVELLMSHGLKNRYTGQGQNNSVLLV